MSQTSMTKIFFRSALLLGFVLFVILLIVVFANRLTFGQRCSDLGLQGAEYDQCVENLSRGRNAKD